MRVLIAGASGLIGTALQDELRSGGHEVRTLVRREPRNMTEYQWRPAEGQLAAEPVEWAGGVVSLSGAPLGRVPWEIGSASCRDGEGGGGGDGGDEGTA